jgi:hypothetical protein
MFEFNISGLSNEAIWSLVFSLGMGFLVHFIYYWYLFKNGDKRY